MALANNSYTYIAADNQVVNFSDQVNYFTGSWPDGILATEVVLRDYQTPLKDGSTFSSMKFAPKLIDLPVLISYNNFPEFLAGMRWLVSALNPKKGLGRLQVRAEDGKERFIHGIYSGGLEGKPLRLAHPGGGVYMITFKAFYPFWQDLAPVTAEYTKDAPPLFFPFFPFRLSQNGIFKDLTITNDGDVPAYPVWRIYGYGEDALIRNLTSGKLLQVTTGITAGTYIEIDTRPGFKTVKLSDGTNVFSALTKTSSLFPLERGANSIRLELNNADANSKLYYSFNTPRLTI